MPEKSSKLLISGFTAHRQNQVVDLLTAMVLDLSGFDRGGKIYPKEVFVNIKTRFSKYSHLPIYQEILDNFNDFETLTREKLDAIGIVKVLNPKNNEEEGFVDVESDLERNHFNGTLPLTINAKDNASGRLKVFLAFIPDYRDGKYVPTCLGTAAFKEYDEVFDKLSYLLADTPSRYDAMRAKLEVLKEQHEWIKSLLTELDNYEGDKERLKKDLVVTMSKTPSKMQTILWEERSEMIFDPITQERVTRPKNGKPKKFFSLRIINSNQNSVDKILKETWIENFKNSKYVTNNNGNLAISKENREALTEGIDNIKTIEDADIWLNSIGIALSRNTLEKLDKGRINGVTFKSQSTTRAGIFFLMRNRLRGVDSVCSDADQELYKYNPLLNNSGIRSLANEESINIIGTYPNCYKNIEWETVYAYTLNNGITHKYKRLLNPDYARKLGELSFNSNSEIYDNWVKRLAKDTYFRANFNLALLDGLRKANSSQKGVQLGNMLSKDLEITSLALFQNQGRGTRDRGISKFLISIPGITTYYILSAIKHKVHIQLDDGILFLKFTKNAIYSVAESEMRRIYKFQNLTISQRKELPEAYRNGGATFFLFPILNKNTFPQIWKGQRLLTENAQVKGGTVREVIQRAIEEEILTEIENKKRLWKNEGILTHFKINFLDSAYERSNIPSEYSFEQKVNYVAADVVINEMLARVGIHQTFIGDPALYAKLNNDKTIDFKGTFDNAVECLFGLVDPGLDLALNEENEYFYCIKLADFKAASTYLKQLKERLNKIGFQYGNLISYGCKEFVTLKEYISVKYMSGRLSTDMYKKIIAKINSGEDYRLSKEEIYAIAYPHKTIFNETIITKELDIASEEYFASTSLPLFPQITMGLELDKLRKEMERLETLKNSTTRAIFKSCNKVGGGFAEVFNDDGTVISNLNLESYLIKLPRSGLRVQFKDN